VQPGDFLIALDVSGHLTGLAFANSHLLSQKVKGFSQFLISQKQKMLEDWELLEQDKRKFDQEYCILSTESQKTLRVFRIKELSLADLVKVRS
jgi:hypothetical protein